MAEDQAIANGDVPVAEPVAAEPADPLKQSTDWWGEARGLLWLVLAVLGFHSLIAKPFYIPSESMMPTLLVGDRLVVTKYPYGYSFVTPTFHVLPFIHGRFLGRMPERGDIVILTPPQSGTDYIKRVIGLPGDRIEVADGALILNGVAVKQVKMGERAIPIDANAQCREESYPGARRAGPDGKLACFLPIIRETLPNGRSYDTIDTGFHERSDNYGPIVVPPAHVFMMGDNRDNSADSRFPVSMLGLGGPVPWENIGGRAEFITFSFDGTGSWNPLTWIESLRPGRAGTSLHPQRDEQPAK